MRVTMRYGERSSIAIDLPAHALVADCDQPRGEPIADVTAAVRAALAEPHAFPALRQAVVPGDKVAIALEPGVPAAHGIVAAVVDELRAAAIAPADVTVIVTQSEEAAFQSLAAAGLALRVHDPADRGQLGYLAATAAGEEVHLNRAVSDADFVVPIGSLRPAGAAGNFGIHGALFPTFASAKTQARLRGLQAAGDSRRLLAEANEVGWLLGTQFTVQVLAGGGDTVLAVLAGRPDAVGALGARCLEEAWSCRVARRAPLVVAAIEGDARQQTWEQFGRALEAASHAVTDDGAIAVCCELSADPGPGVRRIGEADDRPAALKRMRKASPPDLLAAEQLALALDRGPVYLLSRLGDDVVEGLGMAAVADGHQIARLAARHSACIVLGNAPHVVVRVAEEFEEAAR
jgi:nickel-dependent lactate racemase